MIVSWDWLQQYAAPGVAHDEVTRRLMLAGLNHESTTAAGDDWALDIEVTSNRPDCLGHLGIAREAAVLFGVPLKIPAARPPETGPAVDSLTRVTIDCPELCPRYTARVIRGVTVKDSPAWMQRRLQTLGIAAINNVVDITNYVLMECGQPLHAFDFDKLAGPEIVVRRPRAGERLEAIDHRTYELGTETCVIADARQAVGIGGVMGGAGTEVSQRTKNLLIEAAEFDPASIRATARRLNLHSDSSYRFERALDPAGVDWASRRCCELILELAGGELAAGVIDVGRKPGSRSPIVLRLAQLPRILGIEIPAARVREILAALGCHVLAADAATIQASPPSWRRDLEREIDLVEEVARIHGYEAIPEDVRVPMAPSARRPVDAALDKVRRALTALGYDEAMTSSAVERDASEAFSPWTDAAPLVSQTPVLRGADHLRRSLIPSLLAARRNNEAVGNEEIELFEIAHVYWPRAGELPVESLLLGLTGGGDFRSVKGAVETVVQELCGDAAIEAAPFRHPLFDGSAAELRSGPQRLAIVGQLSAAGLKRFDLRGKTTVAELCLAPLLERARLVPQYAKLPAFPAIDRDLNLVVAEGTLWSQLAAVVREAAGPLLERLDYRDTYRHAEQLGADRKSFLLSLRFRDPTATLTGEAVDACRDRIVAACAQRLGAKLRV